MEADTGLLFLESKLPRGSMLMEVGSEMHCGPALSSAGAGAGARNFKAYG